MEPRVQTRVGALGMGEGTPGAGSHHSLSDKPSHMVRSDPLIPVSHSLSIQRCSFSRGGSFLLRLLGETPSLLRTGLPSGLAVTLSTALPLGRHRTTQNADGREGSFMGQSGQPLPTAGLSHSTCRRGRFRPAPSAEPESLPREPAPAGRLQFLDPGAFPRSLPDRGSWAASWAVSEGGSLEGSDGESGEYGGVWECRR